MIMSDYNKEYASKLKEALRRKGYDVKLGEVYDVLAEAVGFKNHHTAKASNVNLYPPIESFGVATTIPIGDGSFDYEVAVETIARIEASFRVKANNVLDAEKLVTLYLRDNTDSIMDDASQWECVHITNSPKMVSIYNESLTPKLREYLEDEDAEFYASANWGDGGISLTAIREFMALELVVTDEEEE
jgi:hypothetical protein